MALTIDQNINIFIYLVIFNFDKYNATKYTRYWKPRLAFTEFDIIGLKHQLTLKTLLISFAI